MKKFYLIVSFFLAIAMGVTAQNYRRIGSVGFAQLSEEAKRGNHEAQFLIGYDLYKTNDEFRKEEAFKSLKSAADAGIADAKLYLGFCYMKGWGIEKNQQEALKLISEASEKADDLRPDSQYDLAMDYYYANKKYVEAAKLFKSLAKKGNEYAMGKLGICYVKGEGVEQNYTEAMKLLKYASEKSVLEADVYLAVGYLEGLGVEKDVNKAVKLLESATYDQPMAACMMGMVYKEGGFGKEKNLQEAIRLFERAAEKGYAEGQFLLGQCYYKGEGVGCSISKAKELYIKAAKQGHEEAQAELKKRFNMDVKAE